MKFCTHINPVADVSGPEVVQDGSLRQIGQVGHVLTFLKLGRVSLVNHILVHSLLLLYNM